MKITKQAVEEAIQTIAEEIAGVSQDPPDGRGKTPSSPIVETVAIVGENKNI